MHEPDSPRTRRRRASSWTGRSRASPTAAASCRPGPRRGRCRRLGATGSARRRRWRRFATPSPHGHPARPPAVPRVRAGDADGRRGARRHGAVRGDDLRRQPPRGRPRRRGGGRGAALAGRRRRLPRVGRRHLRQRRLHRQPQRAGRGARRRTSRARRRVIVAGASAHSSMAAAAHIMGCELVTAPAADAHGRLDGRASSMRRSRPWTPPTSSPSSRRRERPTPAPSTTSPRSPRSAPPAACGCTWTAPTEERAPLAADAAATGRDRAGRLVHRRPARCCTRRSTAPPWSPATARRPAARSRDRRLPGPGCDAEGGDPGEPAVHLAACARRCGCRRRSWPTAPTPTRLRSTTASRRRSTPRQRVAKTPALELVIEPAFTVLAGAPAWLVGDGYAAWCEDALARGVAMVMPTGCRRDRPALLLRQSADDAQGRGPGDRGPDVAIPADRTRAKRHQPARGSQPITALASR